MFYNITLKQEEPLILIASARFYNRSYISLSLNTMEIAWILFDQPWQESSLVT